MREGNVFTFVCPFTEWVPVWPLPMIHWISLYRISWLYPTPPQLQTWGLPNPSLQTSDIGTLSLSPQTWDMGPPYQWHLLAITGDLFKPVYLTTSPPPTGTYGWHAGGTHPTGMLSCSVEVDLFGTRDDWNSFKCKSLVLPDHNPGN